MRGPIASGALSFACGLAALSAFLLLGAMPLAAFSRTRQFAWVIAVYVRDPTSSIRCRLKHVPNRSTSSIVSTGFVMAHRPAGAAAVEGDAEARGCCNRPG